MILFKKKYIGFVLTVLFGMTSVSAQSVRGLVNDGVKHYNDKKYSEAEVNFKKGLEKDFESFEGHFNLGDALYKQGRYEEALNSYKNAMAVAQNDYQKSKVFHNIGNSLLKDKKIKESIEAYKNSLRLDPDDLETKYNLAYAQNMLKQDQNQQQQNQDQKQDKNQDKDKQDQDQQQNQDQQNKDQEQQQQNDQKQDQKQDQQQQGQQQQQPKDQISKEEAKRILEALKKNEAELQKNIRKRKAKVTKKEKDW